VVGVMVGGWLAGISRKCGIGLDTALEVRHERVRTQENLVFSGFPKAPVDASRPSRTPPTAPLPREVLRKRRPEAPRPSTTPAPRPGQRWPGNYATAIAAGLSDPARPDRVEDDLAGQFQEIRVLLHDDRLVTALKNLPDPAVPAIEALGVDFRSTAACLGRDCHPGFRPGGDSDRLNQ
jgi:hypothetical protein